MAAIQVADIGHVDQSVGILSLAKICRLRQRHWVAHRAQIQISYRVFGLADNLARFGVRVW